MTEVNKGLLWLGKKDIEITDKIKIHVPNLEEIFEFDEETYWGCVSNLCATPSDLCYQLSLINVDFAKIDKYECFISFIANGIERSVSELVFGKELDFSKMQVQQSEKTKENVLVQHVFKEKEEYVKIHPLKKKLLLFLKKPLPTTRTVEEYDIVIDRYVYKQIVDNLRTIHGFKENNDVPKNKMAREIMIEEAQEKLEEKKKEKFKSQLLPLASYLSVEMGILSKDICKMTIYELMYDVARSQKINNARLLTQSGYSGFGVDLKKIDKKELNYLSDLNF